MVQRKRRSIMMSAAERDAFLDAQRICRVGSVGPDGVPHVTPLWYVWDGTSIWLYSIIKSQRWVNLQHNPSVSIVVDAGVGYFELHGVEFVGRAEFVGEQPRTGLESPVLAAPERLFARRYAGSETLGYDGRHAWIRVTPDREISWDFRKLTSTESALTPRRQ